MLNIDCTDESLGMFDETAPKQHFRHQLQEAGVGAVVDRCFPRQETQTQIRSQS